MMPAGPKGRVSVTNGIAAAGNSASPHPEAVRQVLAWMGSTEGNQYIGRQGSAIPAVTAAQRVYFDYWLSKGVDVRPFFDVLKGPRIAAPGGAGFAAGNQVLKPYFDEMFLGRSDIADDPAPGTGSRQRGRAPLTPEGNLKRDRRGTHRDRDPERYPVGLFRP